MTDDQASQIARLDERDRGIQTRLVRIEAKLDELTESHYGLRGRVAGWSAGVAGAVSFAVVVVGRVL